MEFLVWGRRNSNEPIDQEEIQATKEGIKQFDSDSRTKVMYGFAGEDGGFAICEVGSANELNQYLTLNPMAAYSEWEVHPIVAAADMLSIFEMYEKHFQAEQLA